MTLLSRLLGGPRTPRQDMTSERNDLPSAAPPALPKIKGVSAGTPNAAGFTFEVSSANQASFAPFGFSLNFYDQYLNNEPGRQNDPGAYVSIVRRNTTFAYKTGKHGWQSGWTFQSRELLAAWLALNLKSGGAAPDLLREVALRKLARPPFDAWTDPQG